MALGKESDEAVQRVLIFGDNNISASMIDAFSSTKFEVHVATTTARASVLLNNAVALHSCDLSRGAICTVLSSFRPHVVISTLAGGSYETQKRIIDCAIECGVQRFMPCEFGEDSLNSRIQSRLPPSAEKARIVRYLEELAEHSKLSWTGIAVGTILDSGLVNGKLGFDLKWCSATLQGRGDERFAVSSAAWVGRATRAAVEHWIEVCNQYLYAAGFTTTAIDVVKCLERTTQQEWTVGWTEVEECVREAERRINRGFPDAGMFLMERSVLFDQAIEASKPFVERDAKTRLGLQDEELEDVVGRAVHHHRHLHGGADCGCG